MYKANEYIETMVKTFNDTEERYNYLYFEIGKADLAQQDLLHTIENETFNAATGYKLARQLKELRTRRRDLKMEMDLITTMRTMFTDRYKQQLRKTYESINQREAELENCRENKIYNNRISDDGKIVHTKNNKLIKLQQKIS